MATRPFIQRERTTQSPQQSSYFTISARNVNLIETAGNWQETPGDQKYRTGAIVPIPGPTRANICQSSNTADSLLSVQNGSFHLRIDPL